MSEGRAPERPMPRLLAHPPKHVAVSYRSWLKFGVATVALAPGIAAAEIAQRKQDIDAWIQANPRQAKALAKRVQDKVDSLATG